MPIKSGQRTFNFALKTSAKNAEAVKAVTASHAPFMKENHTLDATKIHLEHYYTYKAEEFKNPSDPSKGTMSNLLYTINEVYTHEDGIEKHVDAAMNSEGISAFLALLRAHGEVFINKRVKWCITYDPQFVK